MSGYLRNEYTLLPPRYYDTEGGVLVDSICHHKLRQPDGSFVLVSLFPMSIPLSRYAFPKWIRRLYTGDTFKTTLQRIKEEIVVGRTVQVSVLQRSKVGIRFIDNWIQYDFDKVEARDWKMVGVDLCNYPDSYLDSHIYVLASLPDGRYIRIDGLSVIDEVSVTVYRQEYKEKCEAANALCNLHANVK